MIGVICPKRWAKRAVTRNTIKRQIYAVSSELESQLPAACLVLRLAAGFSREQFPSATSPALKKALRAELLALLGKLPQQESAP
jgi:ribonuclease P protein component